MTVKKLCLKISGKIEINVLERGLALGGNMVPLLQQGHSRNICVENVKKSILE